MGMRMAERGAKRECREMRKESEMETEKRRGGAGVLGPR